MRRSGLLDRNCDECDYVDADAQGDNDGRPRVCRGTASPAASTASPGAGTASAGACVTATPTGGSQGEGDEVSVNWTAVVVAGRSGGGRRRCGWCRGGVLAAVGVTVSVGTSPPASGLIDVMLLFRPDALARRRAQRVAPLRRLRAASADPDRGERLCRRGRTQTGAHGRALLSRQPGGSTQISANPDECGS